MTLSRHDERMLEMLYDAGVDAQTMARRIGISTSTVYQWHRDTGRATNNWRGWQLRDPRTGLPLPEGYADAL